MLGAVKTPHMASPHDLGLSCSGVKLWLSFLGAYSREPQQPSEKLSGGPNSGDRSAGPPAQLHHTGADSPAIPNTGEPLEGGSSQL
jgi:hypothetical protein